MKAIKKYFNNKSDNMNFPIDQKVILWDVAHVDKGKHH